MDWSDVPDVCLDLVISKLRSSIGDCLSLAATCRRWRSVAKQSNTLIDMNLLLAVPTSGHMGDQAYTATAARVIFHHKQQLSLHLPEMAGFAIFGSRFGWLIAQSPSSTKLFDPFSRSTIPLPDHPDPVGNAVLTAAPADPDCHVVVEHAVAKTLAFARPGRDAAWRRVSITGGTGWPRGGCFVGLGRRLYCLRLPLFEDSYVCVTYDMSSLAPEPEPEIIPPPPPQLLYHHGAGATTEMTYHLVLTRGGDVCLVMRYLSHQMSHDLVVQIFKLASNHQWSVVESLGNSCLVLHDGMNLVSVDHDPNLIPGCIYFPVYSPLVCPGDKNMIYRPSPTTRTWTAAPRLLGFGDRSLYDDTYSQIYPFILLSPCQRLAYYLQQWVGRKDPTEVEKKDEIPQLDSNPGFLDPSSSV